MALMGEMLSELTIGEFLWEMNSPEGLAANHTTYFRFFLPIAAESSYGGADYVAVWYRRNLRIAANIGCIAEPGDRGVPDHRTGTCADSPAGADRLASILWRTRCTTCRSRAGVDLGLVALADLLLQDDSDEARIS